MKIIPAIDLYDQKCVRLIQGSFSNITVYTDPILLAKKLEKSGVQTIHLCDLNRAKDNSDINSSLVEEIIQSAPCDIQIVGGIKNAATIKTYLTKGVKRVVLSAGTILSFSQEELSDILTKYSAKVTVSVDGVGRKLAKNAWQNITNIDIGETTRKIQEMGFQEIIYTDISRDGTLRGPNYAMIQTIMNGITIPLIVAGGISTVDEIAKLKQMGVGGVIFGKALFNKKFDLKEALRLC